MGPKWIINFPTKEHWRGNTKLEWIKDGLIDLVRVITEKEIRSIAIPPLGCGNGGLDWTIVRPLIVSALEPLEGVDVIIYEPTPRYQNVSKRKGVQKLTPARALISEMVRRYALLGIECSILEVQKLGWFLERGAIRTQLNNKLDFQFEANKFGPYSDRLRHMLDGLDGSYLKCDKRLADAGPTDRIWFNQDKADEVKLYLAQSTVTPYAPVLQWATDVIDGFESPLGMELLATVDWLLDREGVAPNPTSIRQALASWPGGHAAGQRKLKIFDTRLIDLALEQLAANSN
jgi:hypothetical protein